MDHVYIVVIVSLFSIYFVTSGYWVIVSSYRIYQSRKYLRVAARHLITVQSDDSHTNFEQFCYHYRTEIRKYVYLLLIILSEAFCMFLYCMSVPESLNYITFPEIANSTKSKLSECSKIENKNLLEFQYNQVSNPIRMTVDASMNIVGLFVLILVMCLLKYLTQRIKKIKDSRHFRFRLSIVFIALLSVFTIGIAWREYFAIFLMLTTLTIYYYVFLRAVKQFEYTLLQRAYERLIQFGSNKEEFRQYKYFKYTMRTICCGYLLITVGKWLVYFPGLLTSILFYGKCQFPLSAIPSYTPMSEKQVELTMLIQILHCVWYVGNLIGFLGTILTYLLFVCITFYMWIRQVFNSVQGKSKKIYRYRYDLEETLLDKAYVFPDK